MTNTDEYGYLLAHFRENRQEHEEKIFFSLSRSDDPLRWDPLHGGEPVLESHLGTTGVRDPALVRDHEGRFHILATDLRVQDGGATRWDEWSRHGSRSLIAWDSPDLLHWGEPRSVEIAPPEAGMAWAPEVTVDPATGDHIVFWSSQLFDLDDPAHDRDSYSRILYARTRDFRSFSDAAVLIDTGGRDIIDTALIQEDSGVYRVSKDEAGANGWGVYMERGSGLFAGDFEVISTQIASDRFPGGVEAPMILRAPQGDRWYLFLDQYQDWPQGYLAMETTDLDSGRWSYVRPEQVSIPPSTKHGTILRLRRDEWERLRTHRW